MDAGPAGLASRQAPELWPRIRWLLTQKDWIRYRLTGTALIDHSDAAGTAMIDQACASWLEPVCRDVGLALDQLPPIVPSTAPGGGLNDGVGRGHRAAGGYARWWSARPTRPPSWYR